MRLYTVGSGSSGNCYILDDGKSVLVIEAGCKFSEVKKALKFQISRIAGVVVTHRHKDHAGYIGDYLKAGIRVYSLFDVIVSYESCFAVEITPDSQFRVSNYSIYPISVCHDVPCLAFVIDHPDMGRLLFVTDTMMLEYRVPGLNHIMLEANYADDILQKGISEGRVPASMRKRLECSHMELETAKNCLKSNNLEAVNEIVLVHLSDNNSDELRFIDEVQQVTGIPTYAAKAGLTLDLSKKPY